MAEFDKAFISPDIVRVDDKLYKSVVMAKRFPGNELSIAIYPFGLPSTLGNLMVLINQDDLAEVQKLLGEERPVLPMAQKDDLSIASEALRAIAGADLSLGWQSLAIQFMDLASITLAALEASNDTPSDS